MGKKKRRTLPKDFQGMLEHGDVREIMEVFDACDVNAVGGYGKQTAVAFDLIPDEIVRWLVAQGADLSARNTWGRTPLHERVISRRSSIAILLQLGADVSATDGNGNTPLHAASESHHAGSVGLLLAHGAHVDAVNNQGLTPLESGLRTCRNIDIVNTVDVVRALLGAGARMTEGCAPLVQAIGQTFEFHREGFHKESVAAVSESLHTLYGIFGVTPAPRRQMHDGGSPIVPCSATWQEQHEELWGMLVPSSGPAGTVQGEVIRISGRIVREIDGNGGVNWDADFAAMADQLVRLLGSGSPLSTDEMREVRDIVGSIRGRDSRSSRLAEFAVAWVLRNPSPVPLGTVGYKR